MPKIQYYAKKYIRLSRSDEKGKGAEAKESNSVANQRIMLDDFIAQNPDIQDMGEKVDDGYSGIIFERPAFKELMAEIQAGEINCVIVKDLSRLGREYIETGRYLQTIFPAYGVRFIALGDDIDTAFDSEDNQIMTTVKSVVNDTYCRDISTKTRSALAVRRANGKCVSAYTVYGYIKSEEDKNQLVVDEYPASIVRDIYRMKISGLSASGIADELNRRGVLCPLEYKKSKGLPHAKKGFADVPGAKWSPVAIIRILSDEVYAGALVQGRQSSPSYKVKQMEVKPKSEWVRVENAHEAIIAKADYDLVQRLSRLDTRAMTGCKQAPLFSGILVCGSCKNRMTRKTITYKGTQYFYWYCPTGKKACKAPVMLKEEELATCVLESLKAYVANVASLDKIISADIEERAKSGLAKQYNAHIEECKRKIQKALAAKAGLYEHWISGALEKSEHDELKQLFTKDREDVQNSLEIAQSALNKVLTGGDERLRWMERFREFANLTELDRRTVVTLIHSIRVLGKDDLEITFAFRDEYEKTLANTIALGRLDSGREVA